jgi:hypothetical protein
VSEGSEKSDQSSELNFDKVELASPIAARTCPICQKLIFGEYYEVAGNAICSSCAASVGQGRGGALLRGFLFGVGAAVPSTIAWSFLVKTDNGWGILAILIGLFVGYAVRRGAQGVGGWRFQALAMALTYLAITGSHVPLIVEEVRRAETAQQAVEQQGILHPDGKAPPGASKPAEEAPSLGQFLLAWTLVFGVALAAPFLAGTQGFMGLIIIAIALYEAWKLNRRVPVNGPFRLGGALPTT